MDAEMTSMGRSMSFRDSTAPHLSAYTLATEQPQIGVRGGVYTLLY